MGTLYGGAMMLLKLFHDSGTGEGEMATGGIRCHRLAFLLIE